MVENLRAPFPYPSTRSSSRALTTVRECKELCELEKWNSRESEMKQRKMRKRVFEKLWNSNLLFTIATAVEERARKKVQVEVRNWNMARLINCVWSSRDLSSAAAATKMRAGRCETSRGSTKNLISSPAAAAPQLCIWAFQTRTRESRSLSCARTDEWDFWNCLAHFTHQTRLAFWLTYQITNLCTI